MSVSTLSNQTVTIENPTGTRTRTGADNFGSATSATVRFERTYKTIKSQNREREPIHALMGCKPDTVITEGARVTYQSTTYKAITVAEAVDSGGNVHHREVMLQLWSFS